MIAEPASRPRDELPARSGNGNGNDHALPGRYAGNGETGFSPDRSPQNGERRTLHLQLSQPGHAEAASPQPQSSAGGDRNPIRPAAPLQPAAAYQKPQGSGQPAAGNPAAVRMLAEPVKGKEGGSIDHALRERVSADVDAFLAAFDVALTNDTAESRATLREATDRLLRAGARTRIELERLEARVPLPPRERREPEAAAWRYR